MWKDNTAEVISIRYNFQGMFRAFQLADVLTEETNEQFITKLKWHKACRIENIGCNKQELLISNIQKNDWLFCLFLATSDK